MKRRLAVLALCLGLLLTLLPRAAAQEPEFYILDGELLRYSGAAEEVVIPDGVTVIGQSAFYENKTLRRLTVPGHVRLIGRGAFRGCAALEEVTVEEGCQYIADQAFSTCGALRSVALPQSLRYVDDYAFCDCAALTALSMADSTAFANTAFYHCGEVPEKYQTVERRTTRRDRSGFWTDGGLLCRYDGPGGAVVIPDGVTAIADQAFAGCDKITSLVIPHTVKTIGHSAFAGCAGLTELTIPDSVVNIAPNAFAGCKNLRRLTLGSGLSLLGWPTRNPFGSVGFQDEAGKVTYYQKCPALEVLLGCPDEQVYANLDANERMRKCWSEYDPAVCVSLQGRRVTDLSNSICAGLSSDYEKARAIYDWVTHNIAYDDDYISGAKATVADLPETVMESGTAVCDGISRLTQALLQAQGIPALYVSGVCNTQLARDSGKGHAWNMAWVDERWIVIDATWGRPGSSAETGDTTFDPALFDGFWFDPTPLNVALTRQSKVSFVDPGAAHYVGQDDTPWPLAHANAAPNLSTVLVNGQKVELESYTIRQNNYFKLRDLAVVLTAAGKPFQVEWDGGKNAVTMTSGAAYTPVGGELARGGNSERTAKLCSSILYLDGMPVPLTAYTIGQNNYFKLRDLGQALDFDVSWDGATGTVSVDTTAAYTPD